MTAATILGLKKDPIIYWTSTGTISAIMLLSAYYFCFNADAKGAFAHLGFPNYFREELTVAKTLGGLALLVPAVPKRIKDFAYFGIAITVASAIIAHAASGDGVSHVIDPLIVFGILIVSYVYLLPRRHHTSATPRPARPEIAIELSSLLPASKVAAPRPDA